MNPVPPSLVTDLLKRLLAVMWLKFLVLVTKTARIDRKQLAFLEMVSVCIITWSKMEIWKRYKLWGLQNRAKGKKLCMLQIIHGKHMRLNPEHKSCFKRVFCFNLRSFNDCSRVHESVMCPLTLIIKYIFNWFFVHFLTSPNYCDVNSRNTKLGSTIFSRFAVIPKNIFKNQKKS